MVASRRKRERPSLDSDDAQDMSTDSTPTPSPVAHARLFQKTRWVGVVAILASLVPIMMGILAYQGLQRPQDLALKHFDAVFRRVGAVFPFLPLLVRALGKRAHRQWLSGTIMPNTPVFRVLASFGIYLAAQVVRVIIYGLHLTVQRFFLEDRHEQLMSDHAVLAISVQAALSVEVAVATHLSIAAIRRRQSTLLFFLAACTAWTLLVLTSLDMYNTSRYFHEPAESVLALLVGTVLFVAPATVLLLMPVVGATVPLARSSIELAAQEY
jgi:hypothetical protein